MFQKCVLFVAVMSVCAQEEGALPVATVYLEHDGEASERGAFYRGEVSTLKGAYEKLGGEEASCIRVVRDERAYVAEELRIRNNGGITFEGVNKARDGSEEAAIDCDVRARSALFTCEKVVQFRYLGFEFPASSTKWEALIKANEMSTSLTISNCRFVRVGAQARGEMVALAEEEGSLEKSLVRAFAGSVALNTVSCTDASSTALFSLSPFYFEGVSAVSLNGVEISQVAVQNGAAIGIFDKSDKPSAVVIEGLDVQEVNAENGAAAGLEISLISEESTVAIGRTSKCTFKFCRAAGGKAGAMLISVAKATSNLQLPSASNLEIDSTNTANSTARSIFIVAPDFEEFSKQEDAFEFASDFDESASGWVVGAADGEADGEAELVDVYEHVKGNTDGHPKTTSSKNDDSSSLSLMISINVPIGFVILVIVICCCVCR
ncbi:uncharacterized protein MONOS_12006 [Monocercomonoides exilis]|uniref:uncharacterized protein n=1 Tax=Monocercomonoides exilis TaxID=2049356 RepID=UPI00355A8DD7|nr:hypothetical protein MONOS_12006 [Monocercomonoides exilis]|eukprot:MONOS_12006.1-p1 / transcript=MONOS_12006.1 / gene=MONOS_12006 / organism=Monocercomonoides_exilis_PA203 / gene_product=unspecified product / transcript_product=unspecified product / location=Mono_scaffold00636:2487-3791(+) / protein_length=435 / sequence_SO=supercontig / SO=protein_coding / is_pseudo=false